MIASYREKCQQLISPLLESLLQAKQSNNQRLYHAMHYSVMNGGKRVRPLLTLASCEAVGGHIQQAISPACAVELIHAYSLVHDDLPAMDDDSLRRGKPTTHIAFDEATAILAGDALQTLAFELLSSPELTQQPPEAKLRMLQLLAQASGAAGMVGGQAFDLEATGRAVTLEQLEHIHRQKTGALINASVQIGALASGLATEQQLQQLSDYATAIGLAFQVQDDILDITADTQTLGKQQGSDKVLDKATYPALMGLEKAQDYAKQLQEQALDALAGFAQSADILRELARYIVTRKA